MEVERAGYFLGGREEGKKEAGVDSHDIIMVVG